MALRRLAAAGLLVVTALVSMAAEPPGMRR